MLATKNPDDGWEQKAATNKLPGYWRLREPSYAHGHGQGIL